MAAAACPSPSAYLRNKKKFQTIFSEYIDAEVTPKGGRRTTLKCSVPHPTCDEICAALKQLGFEAYVDGGKSYPRSQSQPNHIPPLRGCVRVAIKHPAAEHYVKQSEYDTQTRAACIDSFPNKMAVLKRIAEIIGARDPAARKAASAAQAGAPVKAR